MKRKFVILLLIISTTLVSCSDLMLYVQKDWHINNLNLAEEYFPKYFNFIENDLHENNIQYEIFYRERDYYPENKHYDISFNITETKYFTGTFTYSYRRGYFSSFHFYFIYKNANINEIYELPQKYLKIMADVNDFCSNNFLGFGYDYYNLYDDIIKKYQDNDYLHYSTELDNYLYLTSDRVDECLDTYRAVELSISGEIGTFSIYLRDYFTDINIWDNN